MALTLTNPTLSTTYTSTEIDTNFADVVSKFGNITNADIKSGASIDIDKLSAQYERILVQFQVNYDGTSIAGIGATGGVDGLTVNDFLGLIPLPGDASDTAYEVSDVSWVCTDTGDGNTTVRIEWGYYDTNGLWSLTDTPVTAFALDNASGGGAGSAFNVHEKNGASTGLTFGANPHSLALRLSAKGSGTMDNPGDKLSVSLFLRRKIQNA